MKKALLGFGVFAVVMSGMLLMTKAHAAAASMCGVLAKPLTTSAECGVTGQDYTALTDLQGLSGNQLKSQFISDIKGYKNSSYDLQTTGAAFVISLLGGTKTQADGNPLWVDAVNDPTVTAGISSYYTCENSAYVPSGNYDKWYSPDCGTFTVMYLKHNGTIKFVIKLDCGNPLGGLSYKPDWTLNNYTDISIGSGWSTSDQTVTTLSQNISWKHDVSNSSSSLYSATYNWRVEACYYSSGGSCSFSPNTTGGGAGLPGPSTESLIKPGHDSSSLPVQTNYNFGQKGNAKDGDKFCQRIAYTNGNGPDDTNYDWASNPACVTLHLDHKPSGTIAVSCSADKTTASATATFADADGSSTYPLTATLTGGAVPLTKTVNASSGSLGPATANVPAGGGTVTFKLSVPDVGPAKSSTNNFTATKSIKCTPVTGVNCPGDPQFETSTVQPVSLPANLPTNDTPPSYAWGGVWYSYTDNGYRSVDSVVDQWGEDDTGGFAPPGKTKGPFTLDYKKFINDYPYDLHTPTITYQTYYDRHAYTPNPNAPAYSCYWDANNNWVQGSSSCSFVTSYTGTSDGKTPPTYTCNTAAGDWGGGLNNPTCYHNNTWTGTLVGYYISENASLFVANYSSKQGSTTSTTLNECFPRNFDVKPATATDVTGVSFDNQENPSSATIGTNTTVAFTLLHGGIGVRDPMKVNGLNYTGTYFVEHASGFVQPYPVDNQTLNVGSTMVNGGTASQGYSTSIPVSGLSAGDEVCADFTIDPEGSEVDHTGLIVTDNGIPVPSTQIPGGSTCTAPVSNMPYTRAYGKDVIAGVQVSGGSCTPSSTIAANRRGSGGSGSQFAAMALSTIQGYASAFLRSAAPTAATGLSFANTTGGDGGSLGGPCTKIPDYFTSERPTSGVINASASAITTATIASGSATQDYYDAAGNTTLGGLIIPQGKNVAIFVNGDLFINGDIQFAPGWTWDSVTRTSTVPSLYIIVKGNIDIANNVHNLDGVYIAQPGSGGGTIRTCSAGLNAAYPSGSLFGACSSPLLVNGAFIAQNVRMDRSYDSLRDSFPGENSLSGPQNAAEIFNFSPETYLSNPALTPTSGPDQNRYDYITSLSPVL